MDIRGFIGTSTVDWDGKLVITIFTAGCNLRCPFCFNKELVLNPEKIKAVSDSYVLDFLKKHKDMLDGVCITGGEPTLQEDLDKFCRKVKNLRRLVKLDSNGTNPEVLKSLIESKLVDYIAMDLKAPLSKWEYVRVCGEKTGQYFDKIKESVRFLLKSNIDYEFRTTVVPGLHTANDVGEMAEGIKGAKKYVLQKFEPGNCMDAKMNELNPQSDEEMDKLVQIAKKYVGNVKWRGKLGSI